MTDPNPSPGKALLDAHRLVGLSSIWDTPGCSCGAEIADYWGHLAEVVTEALSPAHAALVELVRLKRVKDKAELLLQTIDPVTDQGGEQGRQYAFLRHDYTTNQPPAWEAAFAIIEESQ